MFLNIITGFLILLSTIDYTSSFVCKSCVQTAHPHHCEQNKTCAPNEKCYIREIRIPSGKFLYTLGCADDTMCAANSIFGKRSERLQRQSETCLKCCEGDLCNSQIRLCKTSAYTTSTTGKHHHIHTKPATELTTRTTKTTPRTQHSTTVPILKNPVLDPTCFNKEEDGISCAYIDMFNMCSATANSTFAYVLANVKCKRHCGLCTPTSANTLAPANFPPSDVCADFEKDGITCVELDLYNICTSTYGLPYMFGHVKCRKHCGFCISG